jgi:hypothetical protein
VPQMAPPKYTLVKHSAASTHPSFKRAVELRSITAKQAEAVVKAGGLIFNSYAEAQDAEMEKNYPPSVKGLIPSVAGSFSSIKVDGYPVYVPAPAEAKAKKVSA